MQRDIIIVSHVFLRRSWPLAMGASLDVMESGCESNKLTKEMKGQKAEKPHLRNQSSEKEDLESNE